MRYLHTPATHDTDSGYILPNMNDDLHSEERLSPEQLKERYRKARDPVLRAHLHIVWQLSLGKPISKVAELTGYSTKWVKERSEEHTSELQSRQYLVCR